MPTHTSLRARLQRGEQTLGVLVPLSVGSLIEMAATAGMDFLLVDCEHGPIDYSMLEHAVVVGRLYDVDVIVRVGLDEPSVVQRALDIGARGIVFPHIDDAARARAAVQFSRYPPLGSRGFSNYGRTGGFGRVDADDHVHAEERDTIVVAMIESAAGCAALDDILAIPGIDGIMSGPADLMISSGATDSSQIAARLADIRKRVSATDRFELAVVNTKDAAVQCLTAGVGMVAINAAPVLMDLFDEWRALL